MFVGDFCDLIKGPHGGEQHSLVALRQRQTMDVRFDHIKNGIFLAQRFLRFWNPGAGLASLPPLRLLGERFLGERLLDETADGFRAWRRIILCGSPIVDSRY
jgi:hypothetical protein